MFSTRVFVLIGVLAIVTMALLTLQASGAPSTLSAPRGGDLTDYALRHRDLFAPSTAAVVSDWFERHPELKSAFGADSSDYYQRHRDTLNMVPGNASDWYERHRTATITISQ